MILLDYLNKAFQSFESFFEPQITDIDEPVPLSDYFKDEKNPKIRKKIDYVITTYSKQVFVDSQKFRTGSWNFDNQTCTLLYDKGLTQEQQKKVVLKTLIAIYFKIKKKKAEEELLQ